MIYSIIPYYQVMIQEWTKTQIHLRQQTYRALLTDPLEENADRFLYEGENAIFSIQTLE